LPLVSALKVALVALVLGAIGTVLLYVTPSWFPVQASVQAERQDELYQWLMIMSSFIFSIVVTFLVYSMWKFRAKPGDMSDGKPIHGHTVLEIAWTLIPLAIVVGFGIAATVVLDRNERPAPNRLIVDVTGQQFYWTFHYPRANVTTGYLNLPPHDVIHDFYVPAFRVKIDAVPGLVTKVWATPTRIGTYAVICNELCGIGHSQMRSIVNVVTPARFRQWIARQKQAAKAPPPSSGGGAVNAKAVFTQNCSSCHTLAAAGATGTVGPNLDNLAADAAKYAPGESEDNYIRDSIEDPGKVVVSGYPNGVMPTTFGQSLSKGEIASLVQLLATKGGT
jgi:cytochrome c oxidase subunit 2